MIETFELAVREVAFWAVLATGVLCLIGGACAVAAWVLKKLLRTFGMYRQFAVFVRSRKGGR